MGKYGLPSIYPAFKRFSKEHPGRHNQIVWPFVNGFWADACSKSGRDDIFMKEMKYIMRIRARLMEAGSRVANGILYMIRLGRLRGI